MLNASARIMIAFVGTPSYSLYLTCAVLSSFCDYFLDSLGQGATGIITKETEKAQVLKEMNRVEKEGNGGVVDDEDTSMKAFGNYSIVRKLGNVIMGFFGGLAAGTFNLRYCFIFLAIYPIFMIFTLLFFFPEKRVNFI
jgi:hypothetical protein